MTESEVVSFLASTPPRTAKLATTRADGRPHVAPIWFGVDDDGSAVFNTGENTVKGRNLALQGRAAVCVDDDRPPFAFVVVEGAVEISRDQNVLRRSAAKIGGRYMGPDRAEEFGARNGVRGEHVVRLRPDRVVSGLDLAD
jgi:PPOX class probable F420-dependent enzyme